MTELDELRRVAYGRTSTPAEEAAAAEARAVLAERLDPTNVAVAPAESEADPSAPDTLTIVDVHDEPGYARRLAATWRVWAGPAFVAFVLGVVLAVASGVLVLNSMRFGDGSISDTETTIGEPVELSGPGDLEAATALLRTPQGPEDVVAQLDPEIDTTTTRIIHATLTETAYAAMAVDGKICLVVVMVDTGAMPWTCVIPSVFVTSGLSIGSEGDGESMQLHWDGLEVSQTVTVSSAG